MKDVDLKADPANRGPESPARPRGSSQRKPKSAIDDADERESAVRAN